jgi:hypothetical protein
MSLIDLFKPKYKHSDTQVRMEAVRSLDSQYQEILIEIARQDESTEIRKLALKKIHNPPALLQISKQEDTTAEIRKIAHTLYCEEIVQDIKKSTEPSEAAKQILQLESIQEDRYLEDVAKNAQSPKVRLAAVKRIQKEGVLLRIAVEDGDEEVALAALESIHRGMALKEIMERARAPKARASASVRYKSVQSQKQQSQEQVALKQKQDALISSLKRVAQQEDCLQAQPEFASLQQEATQLQLEKNDEYISIVKEFTLQCTQIREQQEKNAKEQQELEQKKAACLQVCQKIEDLVNQHVGEEAKPQFDAFMEQWEQLCGVDGAQFSDLQNRVTRSAERFMEQLRNAEQIKHTLEQERARRTELLQQLTQLQERDNYANLEGQLHGLRKAWEHLNAGSNAESLEEEFQKTLSQLFERIHSEKEQQAQDQKETEQKLDSLIKQVQAIDEKQDFREISRSMRDLHVAWRDAVGDNKKQYHAKWQEFKRETSRFEEMQEWEHWYNEKDRETILEDMASDIEQMEGDGDLYKKIRSHQAEWRKLGPVSTGRIEHFKESFAALCEQGFQKCEPWLLTQQEEREKHLQEKQVLIDSLQGIVDSNTNSWKDTAHEVREMQDKWREIGPVPREASDEIWQKFKQLCDAFYDKHREFLKEEEQAREENFEKKVGLCEQAEVVAQQKRWKEGSAELKELQKQWKEIGAVPKAKSEELWDRFRKACDSFFEAKREYYEKIDTEKKDNLSQKTALCEKMEELSTIAFSPELISKVGELHTAWRSIGAVPRDQSDTIWERFCKAEDVFYQKRLENDPSLKEEIEANLEQKREIIKRAQEIADQDNMSQAGHGLRDLQNEWKDLGRTGNFDQELWQEFRAVCDDFFERRRDQFEIMEQVRINNLEKKQLLCEQAEQANQMQDNQAARHEIKHLRKLWKEIGPVPRNKSDKIWDRFQTACNSVFTDPSSEDA